LFTHLCLLHFFKSFPGDAVPTWTRAVHDAESCSPDFAFFYRSEDAEQDNDKDDQDNDSNCGCDHGSLQVNFLFLD